MIIILKRKPGHICHIISSDEQIRCAVINEGSKFRYFSRAQVEVASPMRARVEEESILELSL